MYFVTFICCTKWLLRQCYAEQKFSFNCKVAKTSHAVLKALESGNIPKAKEEPNKGISLIYTRQKIIKLADKSEFGWATVQEYVSDELAGDEADPSNVFWIYLN